MTNMFIVQATGVHCKWKLFNQDNLLASGVTVVVSTGVSWNKSSKTQKYYKYLQR